LLVISVPHAVAGAALAILAAANAALPAEPPALERGRTILGPYKKALKQELLSGLTNGLDQAVVACRLKAPDITSDQSTRDVRVGRTSHKLRNPKNAPEDWMKPLLTHYRDHPDDQIPRAVPLANGRIGYVEPIFIQPLCLTCHGHPIPEEVTRRIREAYPADEATGFTDGSFRGLFWATFPAP